MPDNAPKLTALCDALWTIGTPILLPEAEARLIPRAIPITQQRSDGTYNLVGLTFGTALEAEIFADGLTEHCRCDGKGRVFFKTPCPIIRDGRGNCTGIN